MHIVARLLVALLLAGTVQLSGSAAFGADSVPFADPGAKGSLGLCDAADHPITSGSVLVKPFVVKAVSSEAAPEGYGPKQLAKGTLYGYQPRKGVDPGDWSGTQLTASSFYSNAAHPMAEGTTLDPSLKDYFNIYPDKYDGFIELRLFLSAPNKQTIQTPYAAAVLHVQGDTWTLVRGTRSPDCGAGKTKSAERVYIAANKFPTAAPAPSTSAGGSTPQGGDRSSASGTTGGKADQAQGRSPADSPTFAGVDDTVWYVVGPLALLAAVVAGLGFARSRGRSGPLHPTV
jgi:hypothetical protein